MIYVDGKKIRDIILHQRAMLITHFPKLKGIFLPYLKELEIDDSYNINEMYYDILEDLEILKNELDR